jgi:type IV pilus assembly protein PilQ
MSARLLRVLAGALVLSSYVQAAGHAAPPTARLTGVSTKTDGPGTTVVIATTEPVAYVAAQPDPLTLVVDLRNVAPGEVRPDKPAGAVANVAIEPVTGDDGTAIARVRMLLARPQTPQIYSRANSVIVQFGAAAAAAASVPAPPAAAPVEQRPAADNKAADPAVRPSPGSALTKVDTAVGPDGTRVTFSGTGSWRAGAVQSAKDLPPRLVIDFPELRSTLPAVTRVGQGPVDQIRVAVNRAQPLVTRAVIDLKYPAPHRVESADGAVVIVFGAPASGTPAAPSAAPRARMPETATEPRPETRPEIKAASVPAPAPKAAAPPAPAPAAAAPAPVVKAPSKPEPVIVAPAPEAKAQPKAEFTLTPPKPAAPEQKPPAADVKPAAQDPKPTTQDPKAAVAEPKADRQAPAPQPPKSPMQKPAPAGAPEQEKQYTGHLVTFDFYQADLRSVLRTFSEISGLNIVIDPTVPAGTVDVSLREVPWDQALEVILRSHQLGYLLDHNVVRIAPLSALAKEEQERQKLADAQAMSGQLKVYTRTLSYAKAADVAKLLKDTRVLSSRGSALVDERTNTLIINDLPDALDQCESLIGTLDRSEPQVEIEAKIVQTSTETARALGVQWGVAGRMASDLANTAPISFPAQSSVTGRTRASQGALDLPSAVNLPVPAATSALGISMGTLTGSFNLDVALTAIEKKGEGKILSQPRVMMQNNFEAEMTQGVQIPIQTVSNNTVTVTFKDAALTLKVKPQITASNTVMMAIALENASPDYSRSVNGIPPIDTQRAVTRVLVNDAETMVIGGIMKSEETNLREGVPGLSRIPLLGWLFRRDSVTGDQRELLIFITPRIRR